MKTIQRIAFFLFIATGFSLSAQNKTNQIYELLTYCHNNGIFNESILVAADGEIIYHKSLNIQRLGMPMNVMLRRVLKVENLILQ